MSTYNLNQIVKGHKAGTFVIIGFKSMDGVQGAFLKSVNHNYTKCAHGQIWLPLNAIREV